jgi:sterol desaturase/sphingolipid hydroxylase (fatty acid hydroxylase superfamily)
VEPAIHANEAIIRLTVFVLVLLLMAAWEAVRPRRQATQSKPRRWFGNLTIVVIDALVLRLCFPILAVGLAFSAAADGWGLFNFTALPVWLEVVLAVILLDCLIYWQHRVFHVVPWFWRLHRMHHADNDFDASTALRFHPIEIVLSMLLKLAAVVVLGPAPLAVLIFEILLNGTAMFNHGNVRVPIALDRYLRWFVVTPDMHRVHHSVHSAEYNRNFGFNLPWWDRLFGSYAAQPRDGHEAMTIGLSRYRGAVCANVGWMLMLPFRNEKTLDDDG